MHNLRRMRSRAAVVTATFLTMLLGLSASLGCLLGLVTLAPSGPCPDDTTGSLQRTIFAQRLLSVLMVSVALLSIVVAWRAVSDRHGRPWPWLAASLAGLVFSAALVMPIDRISSC